MEKLCQVATTSENAWVNRLSETAERKGVSIYVYAKVAQNMDLEMAKHLQQEFGLSAKGVPAKAEGEGRYNHRGSGIQISIRAQNKTEEYVGKDYRLMIMRG